MPRPLEAPSPQPVEISTHRHLTAVGMSDAQRLQQLSEPPSVIPPRKINIGEEGDPFGLLEQDDTYEVLAGLVFQECEGIFRQLVKGYPEVGAQFRRAHKKPRQVAAIEFPEVELTDLYTYGMTREADSTSTQYLFHRTDPGYEEKGFRVIKKDDGHVVLKNADLEGTDIEDDQSYYLLLHNAQQWVQDYADQLNIAPANLLNLARMNIEPPTLTQRVAEAGEKAAKVGRDALSLVLTTKAMNGDLRPRWATLAAAAALVPVPGAHEIAGEAVFHGGEAVFHGGEAVVGGVVSGVSAVGTEIGRITVGTADVVIGWFDAIHDVYSPHHYGPSKNISLSSEGQTIIFDGSYDLSKQASTPLIDGGQVTPGTMRRVDPATLYKDGFKGIKAGECTTTGLKLPGAKSIDVFDTDPNIAGDLSITPSNTGLVICNTTVGYNIPDQNLRHIFIQPKP